ncbi:MAG TPA: DNA polymerase III subunit alpha, partial [Polyangiaceae bacterium]|nr:DNA polymerase III subunit alpha [Polyangiaceae bacterium]
ELERYEAVLVSGEPVLVSGKLQFRFVEEAEESFDKGSEEPTLLLDEVSLLSDAIRAETRAITIRLGAGVERGQIARLAELLRASKGGCPVQLVIETEDGAQAVLALARDLRVEPSDQLLASLERLFGAGVAELR